MGWGMLAVWRAWPVIWSMPISPRARPTSSATMPRSRLLPSTALTVVKASTISMKYSGGPRRTACRATSGAKNVTSTVAMLPATNEPMAAGAGAAPARPPLPPSLAPVPGHFVALQGGAQEAGLARRVQQERGGRAAVHRAVINAGKKDHRGRGFDPDRDRQQHGHGHRRPDAGQHAHGRAYHAADKGPQQIDGGGCGGKTVHQQIERLHGVSALQPPRAGQAGQVDGQQLRKHPEHRRCHGHTDQAILDPGPQAQVELAFRALEAPHRQHEAQRAAQDEAQRGDQQRIEQQSGRHPEEALPMRALGARACLQIAQAPGQRMQHTQQRADQQRRAHQPGEKIRAHAAVAGLATDRAGAPGRGSRPRNCPCWPPRPATAPAAPSRHRAGSARAASATNATNGALDGATNVLAPRQTIPDLAIVARRLANSASTKLANSSPASQAGVQRFLSIWSCQAGCLKVRCSASISTLRCPSVMPGAPYTPRQLPISTSMPCSLSVGTFTPLRRVPEVTPTARILPAAMYSANSL